MGSGGFGIANPKDNRVELQIRPSGGKLSTISALIGHPVSWTKLKAVRGCFLTGCFGTGYFWGESEKVRGKRRFLVRMSGFKKIESLFGRYSNPGL